MIGKFVTQPAGFKAFIPDAFPPTTPLVFRSQTQLLAADATLALGKLDGIAQLIPDIDFFIYMYVRKEATLSSNIEGTKATMHDSLKADLNITEGVPRDVENILHYVKAVNYGLSRLKSMPLILRVIRELHEQLMAETAEGVGKTPGEIRKTQNWIGGTRPDNADFVPPPVHELGRVLSDFENFLNKKQSYPALINAALMHAQFETIHPFLDGNGRTGRLLITMYLCRQKVLEYPILYLSEYFKRHRDTYFDRLSAYHNKGEVNEWVEFFLEGVAEVAREATDVSKHIITIREQDMTIVHALGGKQAPTAVKLLKGLYSQPIVDVAAAEKITGLSRPAANQLIKKFVNLGILQPTDEAATYGRQFAYQNYIRLFTANGGGV
ncbi:MAG TPA: Fic family protein [Candidatus Saccharimonas sp.]|nr:Fic family protein [Candidatus Saccharimonas sp.]